MSSSRRLFAFGCSKDVCRTLNEWMFLSGIILQEYQSFKRVLADVSRQSPEVIFINVDVEKGIQLLDSLRVEEDPPLLVGISSGIDRGQLFSRMFSHSLADYYTQRPIQRGFLDELLARSLGDSSIVEERSKVDIKELSDMVSQRDLLKDENRILLEKLEELTPERDRLQLQLAELLSISSKHSADIERLEIDFERKNHEQEAQFEQRLDGEKENLKGVVSARDKLLEDQEERITLIEDLQSQLSVLEEKHDQIQQQFLESQEKEKTLVPREMYEGLEASLASYTALGQPEEIQEQIDGLRTDRSNLQEQIKKGEEDLSILGEELSSLREEVPESFHADYDALQATLLEKEQIISALQKKENQLSGLNEEETELQEMYDQLRHDFDEREQEQKILKDALDALREEKSNIKTDKDSLVQESSRVEEELSFLRVEKDGLLDHLEELEGQLDSTTIEKDEFFVRIRELEEERELLREAQIFREEKVQTVEDALSGLQGTHKELQKEHEEALSELVPLREDMVLLQVQLDEDQIESQREIEVLIQERDGLLSTQEDFEIVSREYEAEITELRTALTGREENPEEKVQLVEDLEREHRNLLDEKIQKHKEAEEVLFQKVDVLTKENLVLKTKRAELEIDIQEVQSRLEEEEKEQKGLLRQVEKLSEKTADFTGLYTRYSDLKEDYDSLEGAHHVLDEELKRMRVREKERNEQLEKQIDVGESQKYTALQRELDQIQEGAQSREDRIQELEKQLRSMISEEELSEALSQKQEREYELSSSKEEHKELHQEFIDLQTFTNLEIETIEEEMNTLRAELAEVYERSEDEQNALREAHKNELDSLREQVEEKHPDVVGDWEKEKTELEERLSLIQSESEDVLLQLEEVRKELLVQSNLLEEKTETEERFEKEQVSAEEEKKGLDDPLNAEFDRVEELGEELILLQESYDQLREKEGNFDRVQEEVFVQIQLREALEDQLEEVEELVRQKEDSIKQKEKYLSDVKENLEEAQSKSVKTEEDTSLELHRIQDQKDALEQEIEREKKTSQSQREELDGLRTALKESQGLEEDLLAEKEHAQKQEKEIALLQDDLLKKERELLAVQEEKNQLMKEVDKVQVQQSEEVVRGSSDALVLHEELRKSKIISQKYQMRVGMAELRADAAEEKLENLVNHTKGVDTEQSVGSSSVLEEDLLLLEQRFLDSTKKMDHLQRELVEKQEAFNTQQQEMHSDIVEKDKHLENLQEEQELLREALEVSESRWEEAQDEYAREKATLERLATERALEELEEEREVFTEERERLQEERLRVSRRVEELEGKQEAVEQQCTELQEILRVERLHHTEKLEQERRAGELEKRIAKAEKAKMATKNKGVKLKLKRHFDLLQAELRQTKKRLEELGSEQKVSVPEWPFSDDDFL